MMRGQAALLKHEIEAKLANRIPAALSPMALQAPRLQPIGNARLDALLGGGLPLGSICELTGAEGSGRTSIALSLLASASAEGACAYMDVSDTLSPQNAAAAGIELANLLWVRFASAPQARRPAAVPPSRTHVPDLQSAAAGHLSGQLPGPQSGPLPRPLYGGCGRSHPRGETRGIAPVMEQMLFQKEERRRRKVEGTPGNPNQPLGLHTASKDQVDWERFNLRRVDESDPLRQMDQRAAEAARIRAAAAPSAVTERLREQKPWDRMDGALRATDQVLQSGGFRIVVMDLASVEPKEAFRIPSATWFRFRRAAQESDAILLLLTQEPCARSSAACVVECAAGEPPTIRGVLTVAPRTAEIARQRTGTSPGKKAPGRATDWHATPAWMRAAGR